MIGMGKMIAISENHLLKTIQDSLIKHNISIDDIEQSKIVIADTLFKYICNIYKAKGNCPDIVLFIKYCCSATALIINMLEDKINNLNNLQLGEDVLIYI